MQTTGNLGLKKPEGTDIVDISDLNGNMDILDNTVNGKVDKITGKQLSTNDYTTAEKTKLTGIAAGANNYTHPNHTGDVTSTGDGVTAIAAGVIVDADVNAAAGIAATKIGTGVVSNAEFGYLDGVTSGIQAQLAARPLLTTTPQQTTAALTYYVRTDGNDANTGLANTAGGAFKTIQKAINSVPKHVDHLVNIYVAAGTYVEDVTIKDFNGSTEIFIYGGSSLVTAANYLVNSIYVYGCVNQIYIQGFTAISTARPGFSFVNSVFGQLVYCRNVTSASGQSGANASNHSSARISACEFSNRNGGLEATQGSTIVSANNIGTGNQYGIYANDGGVISKEGTQPTGTTPEHAYNRGIITSGVLNPWGDNTNVSRTYGELTCANGSTDQSIEANAWKKLLYTGVFSNQKLVCDLANSQFVVPEDGLYEINLRAGFSGTSLTHESLGVYVNGGLQAIVAEQTHSGIPNFSLSGSTLINLARGTIITMYAYTSVACTILRAFAYTQATIIRVG